MFNDGFINIIREEIMKLIKTFISVLFSAFLLFSSTSSFAVEKLHFLIGGGAGGGWDGTARGTGEALTKAGFLKSASFENASVSMLDGLRVEYEDGWGLLRASNTTPKLVLRFEGTSQKSLDGIIRKFDEEFQKVHPNLDKIIDQI